MIKISKAFRYSCLGFGFGSLVEYFYPALTLLLKAFKSHAFHSKRLNANEKKLCKI